MPITGAPPAVPVGVRVYRTVWQAIPTGVWTAVIFQAQRWDDPNDDQWAAAPNPTRLTCQRDGLYVIAGHVRFVFNNVGLRNVRVMLNGATIIVFAVGNTDPAIPVWRTLATTYKLSVGDFVELFVEQTSGGDLNLEAFGNYAPEFSMAKVG